MDCNKASELMNLALDSMLSEEEAQSLQQHLDTCEACREDYELYQSIQSTLISEDAASLPDNFHEDLMQRIEAEKVVPLHRKFNYKQLNIAAAIVVLLTFGILGLSNLDRYDMFNRNASYEYTEVAMEAKTERKMDSKMAPAMEMAEEKAGMAVMDEAVEETTFELAEAEVAVEESDMADSATIEEATVDDGAAEPAMLSTVEVADTELVDEEASDTTDVVVVTTDGTTDKLTLTFDEDNGSQMEREAAPQDENLKAAPEDELSQDDRINLPLKLIGLLAGIGIFIAGIVTLIFKLNK